uniref:Uncharacterized protein n=1 Tax=Rhizophora mucronata TaxID=61149 RepID=A0A2P2PWD8_RHIMU
MVFICPRVLFCWVLLKCVVHVRSFG